MMDRLTIPYELSNGYHRSPNTTWNTILNRLAEYEDTGLTPEEVVSLNTFTDSQCEKLLAKNGELEKEIKRLQIKLGDAGTVCHGCPYPRKYKALEKELAHYKQLKADGRLIELPCKVGDTVRADVYRPYNGHTATIHGEVTDVQAMVKVKYSSCRYVNFLASDFGKTVFHEQASQALGERIKND